MTSVDSQRIKEIRDNTRAMAEAFGRIADALAEALELYVSTQTETQNSNLTFEKDECAKEYEELGLKDLKELINADRKIENSSEKPNNCETCKHNKLEWYSEVCDGCSKAHSNYESQRDCDNLINAVVKLDMSREDKFKVIELLEQHCEKCKHYLFTDIDGYYCEHETYGQRCAYEPKDEPQTDIHDLTDCDFCKDRNCKDCEGGKGEPQTDCAWR